MLRPYQQRAVDEVCSKLPARPIMVMPTGAGKTYAAVEIVRRVNKPTLWIAHRRELVHQAAESLTDHGLPAGVIMAGEPRTAAPVQVASVQTAIRRNGIDTPGLIVIDECHHVRAGSYTGLLERFPKAMLLGLTATPFRLDGKGLGDAFGEIVAECYADDLCSEGFLVEPIVYAPDVPDLSGVPKSHGDYSDPGLMAVMGKPKLVGNIVETWQKRATGKRTVCFAVNIAHSEYIVSQFRERGAAAEHIDGRTPKAERDAVLHRLRDGTTTIVSNCQVLTEGWDLPALEVAIIARPTASLCLHLQTIGRIMRAAPEKLGALVLDHAGNHLRHGPVTQRIEYSLEDYSKVKGVGALGQKRCPGCYLMVDKAETECPECGYDFEADAVTRARIPATAPGELVDFRKRERPSIEAQRAAWASLEWRRQQFGYREGWSLYQFKRMFGFWPLTYNGEIVDAKRAGFDVKRKQFDRLEEKRIAKGYKPGWTGYQFKAIFGHWPRFR